MSVIDPDHVLPRTYEWNAAVEQSITNADVLALTYVGAGGRKLMRKDIYIARARILAASSICSVITEPLTTTRFKPNIVTGYRTACRHYSPILGAIRSVMFLPM